MEAAKRNLNGKCFILASAQMEKQHVKSRSRLQMLGQHFCCCLLLALFTLSGYEQQQIVGYALCSVLHRESLSEYIYATHI